MIWNWVVEAVDSKGKTIWREVFDSRAEADKCHQAALADSTIANVHCWEM